jgi:hypothetical protein
MTKIFSIDYRPQIESGDYSLTCNGKPIQIVKWDCNGPCPILGVMKGDDDKDEALFFTEQGYTLNEKFWLYVEIPNNYDDVERAIESLVSKIDGDYAIFMQSYDEYVKEFSPIIMKAAEDKIARIFNGNYAWLKGREQAYKNMKVPVWKQIEADYEYPLCLTREMDVNGDWHYCMSSGKIYDGCQYILLAELEQLPIKEESV